MKNLAVFILTIIIVASGINYVWAGPVGIDTAAPPSGDRAAPSSSFGYAPTFYSGTFKSDREMFSKSKLTTDFLPKVARWIAGFLAGIAVLFLIVAGIQFLTAGGDPEKIDFDMVIQAAEKGDAVAKKIVDDAGEYLGAKIAFLVNLFNPEVIVVGRGIEKAGDFFFTTLRKSVRRWAYEESVKIVKVLPASLGEESIAVGAGALVTQEIFAKA